MYRPIYSIKANIIYEELYIFERLFIFEGLILENITNINLKTFIKYCYVHKISNVFNWDKSAAD